MREVLGVFYVLLLQCVVLAVSAVGVVFSSISSIFSAAASTIHVHFLRVAHRHDEQYAPKDAREPKVVFRSSGDSAAN